MLRLMLTCHRSFFIPPEAGFAVWLYEKHRTWDAGDINGRIEDFVSDVMKSRKIETWRLDEVALKRHLKERQPGSYPEAVSCIYEWCGRCRGERFERWGDKNNFYIGHIMTLDEMFPDAQFVHIVRDGRNVACSYRRLANQGIQSEYAPKLPTDIEEIAWEWQRNTSKIGTDLAAIGKQRAYELRLEDLAREPRQVLSALCEFLGEEFDPQMLQFHQLNQEHELEPREFLQWKEKTLEPPMANETETYKTQLDPEEISAFEAIAGSSLRRYRYRSG
jgi:hypothetical protein